MASAAERCRGGPLLAAEQRPHAREGGRAGGALRSACCARVVEVGRGGSRRTYAWDAQSGGVQRERAAEGEQREGGRSLQARAVARLSLAGASLRRAFLPRDVTDDYWDYARWRCCQRVASSMLNVLATQQMLFAVRAFAATLPSAHAATARRDAHAHAAHAAVRPHPPHQLHRHAHCSDTPSAGQIGVGAERGLAAAATVNWVLKDGLGRLGKLAVSTKLGSSFDADLKGYRFCSSIVYNVAHSLEFATAVFPHYFLPLATVANVGKSIGVSTSMSITPAIHRSFALTDNMADISAKMQAQQVVADNVGLALAIVLTKVLAKAAPSKGALVAMPFVAYPVLATLDMFFIRNELRSVALRTLNVTRAEIVADEWLARGGGRGDGDGGNGRRRRRAAAPAVEAPTAREVALQERVLPGRRASESVLRLEVGPLRVGAIGSEKELVETAVAAGKRGSVLLCDVSGKGERVATLVVGRNASTRDILRGVLEAAHMRKAFEQGAVCGGSGELRALQLASRRFAEAHVGDLEAAMAKAGWKLANFKLSAEQSVVYHLMDE